MPGLYVSDDSNNWKLFNNIGIGSTLPATGDVSSLFIKQGAEAGLYIRDTSGWVPIVLYSAVTAGKYGFIDVDSQGRITGATNPTTLADYNITDAIQGVGISKVSVGSLASRPAASNSGILYITSDVGNHRAYLDIENTWVDLAESKSNQVQQVQYGSYGASLGNTIIPADTSTPLSTEGTVVWSQSITPTSTQSKIKIETSLYVDSSSNGKTVTVALFRGTTCIRALPAVVATAGRPIIVHVLSMDIPASTSAVTYSLRVGISSSATWYVNQGSASKLTYGGSANGSTYLLTEIL